MVLFILIKPVYNTLYKYNRFDLMHKHKQRAIALRKQGHSYKAIEEKLGIWRSTLSVWFSCLPWSQAIQKKLLKRMMPFWKKNMQRVGRERADMWRDRRAKAREEAETLFPRFKKDSLFVAGLMLYWSEGDSKLENSLVRITNTHPKMLLIFSRFLKKYCRVRKEAMKLMLILYPDLSDSVCRKYWTKNTQISRFGKTQFIKGRHPTKRLLYGIGMLNVCGCELKEKIMQWIALYQNELVR